MQLDAAETELLKTWVIHKLENISDADSDVLGDYVLALVKTDEPECIARASCIENLQDFLLENTEGFVNEVFTAIRLKSYDPNRPPPKIIPTASVIQQPSNASQPRKLNGSKKRSYQDLDNEAYQEGRSRGGRGISMKQPKRQRQLQQNRAFQDGLPYDQPMLPVMPTPPAGMPLYDLNNPMATIMAMQEFIGSMMPGMANFGMHDSAQSLTRERCRDYDTKGFCTKGISCPYEHGSNPYIVPQDGQREVYNGVANGAGQTSRVSKKTRGRRNNYSGGLPSVFSQPSRRSHKSKTSLVIEQIPEDKNDEQNVRAFFSQFGEIDQITMHPELALAIVKYVHHSSATAAYESPKSVFDNRFVKVYWQKSDVNDDDGERQSQSADPEMDEHEPRIDIEELTKRQEEAQRKYEDIKRQREEAQKQRTELEEKLQTIESERIRISAVLAKKTGVPWALENENGETEGARALKAQLAQLEAEAKHLGIDPDAPSNDGFHYTTQRGRGGFRGSRGRGRGSYPSFRGGAVKRLDNRPKAVAVQLHESAYEDYEETLRQFLLFSNTETASLAKHPSLDDSAIVSFTERYQAENFMVAIASGQIPQLPRVELSWYKPDEPTNHSNDQARAQVKLVVASAEVAEVEPQPPRDMDTYDAEDADHWS
ncbi:Hypothetical protein R9X50_00093100 [Acrodontium crateriforme]|uniref:C3H1-type domain-containing protein n=1 Tax=Acrodontium crateriforme TaxID=150365 RepID=A0AAQ3R2D5_9PEZI|nr:Hypothetical protein R9X50_00093100 [Acrodontium crateriforme]